MKMTRFARKGVLLAATLSLASLSATAGANETMTWDPLTPTGGAPADPSYWDRRAELPFTGSALNQANVTLAPQVTNVNSTETTTTTVHDYSVTTTNDYSTPTTNVAGDQTVVQTSAQMGDGSELTVTTQHND